MSDGGFESNNGNRTREENFSSTSRDVIVTDNLDTIFNLLRSSRGRYLLYFLYSAEENVLDCEDAVSAVYRYEKTRTKTDTQPARNEIQVELHHNLLPLFEQAGVLEYDAQEQIIRFREPSGLEEWVTYAQRKELK